MTTPVASSIFSANINVGNAAWRSGRAPVI
jgi:hypothetical protein